MRIGRYESSDNGNLGTAITFLLIGLGAGALAGLLLAPKSGKLLRKDLKEGYDDAIDTASDWAGEAKKKASAASDRVREVASRGVEIASDLGSDLRDTVREKAEPLRRVINRG